MEYLYKNPLPDGTEEIKTLTIESRIGSFSENEEVNNPTGNGKAYFYGISIDGREQLTTFKPGEEGYQPMTKIEAQEFLDADITQTLLNYGINA